MLVPLNLNTYDGASTVAVQFTLPPAHSTPPRQPVATPAADSVTHEANVLEQDVAMDPPQADSTSPVAGNALSSPTNAPPTCDSTTPTAPRLSAREKSPTVVGRTSRSCRAPPRSARLQPTSCTPSAPPPGSASVPDMQELEAEETEKRTSKRKGRALSTGPCSKKKKAGGQLPSNSASSSRTVSAASSQDSSTTLVDTPDAPAWAVSLQLFCSITLGSEWDALLSNWVKFEEASGYQDGLRLGTKNRPRAIADWIQNARKPTFRPEIKNIGSFSVQFNAWWTSLQPDWRTNGPDTVLLRDGEDWECLRRPGLNGLLSVIAALFFWGRAMQKLPADAGATWLEAVDDVSYSIAQLLRTTCN